MVLDYDAIRKRIILGRQSQVPKKWSRVKLAEMVGVTKGTIYNWESGASDPNMENLYKVAEAFGIDPETFIFGSKGKRRESLIESVKPPGLEDLEIDNRALRSRIRELENENLANIDPQILKALVNAEYFQLNIIRATLGLSAPSQDIKAKEILSDLSRIQRRSKDYNRADVADLTEAWEKLNLTEKLDFVNDIRRRLQLPRVSSEALTSGVDTELYDFILELPPEDQFQLSQANRKYLGLKLRPSLGRIES